MMNYYERFEKQIEDFGGQGKRLLLHACCCPCSSHCLELLCGVFDITVYFYNPNIDEREEYDKRIRELERFREEASFARDIKIVDGPYEPERFYEMARGRENLPERSERCYDCYQLRLRSSAEYAVEHDFDFFSTTLSISPYKSSRWINEIGMKIEKELSMEYDRYPVFLFSDFKKKNGYKRSIELSNEYSLYRQDYCGCVFSKRDRDRKRQEDKES